MRGPMRMLDGRRVIVVVIVVLGQVDMRRRQHRGKYHRRNEQWTDSGPADPGGNHAGILSAEAVMISKRTQVDGSGRLKCS